MQLYFSLALLAFTISHTYALPMYVLSRSSWWSDEGFRMEGSDSVAVFKRDDGSVSAPDPI